MMYVLPSGQFQAASVSFWVCSGKEVSGDAPPYGELPMQAQWLEVTADADSGNVQGDNQEVMSLEYLLLFNMIF